MTVVGELCTSCAQCCSGKIFAATTLDPDERQRLGVYSLPQPCPKLGADNRCAIYATRPKACVDFLCPTAGLLQCGKLTLIEARRALGVLPPGSVVTRG